MDDLPALPPGTGVMLCGHGSRNQLAVGEFADLDRRSARAPARRSHRVRLSRVRRSGDPPRPRQAARAGAHPHPRRARHAVRGGPRQERHPLGAQHLCRGASRDRDHLRPRAWRRSEDAARRRRPDRGGPPRLAADRLRAPRRCCSSSAAAPPTPMPTPMSQRSCACCGRAWGLAGARSPIPASPSRW